MNSFLFLFTLTLVANQGPVISIAEDVKFIQIVVEDRLVKGYDVYLGGPDDKKLEVVKGEDGKRFQFLNMAQVFHVLDQAGFELHVDLGRTVGGSINNKRHQNFLFKRKE